MGDAVAEADHFIATAGWGSGDLLPVLDLETTGGLGVAKLQAWVSAFLGRIYDRTGVRALIYTLAELLVQQDGQHAGVRAGGLQVAVGRALDVEPVGDRARRRTGPATAGRSGSTRRTGACRASAAGSTSTATTARTSVPSRSPSRRRAHRLDCWPHGSQPDGSVHPRRRRAPTPAPTRSSTWCGRRSSATTRRSPGRTASGASPTPTTRPPGRSLGVHRGLHPRRGPAAVREHAHRVVGHRAPDHALPRGGAAARARRASAATPSATPWSSAAPGSTAAINRLVDVLNLRLPADLDDRWDLRSRIPPEQRPVVFIGPFEHHSNELPWRESIADVVTIREDRDGYIDLDQLARGARPVRRTGR